MRDSRVVLVLVTGPNEAELARIGRQLVEERLAACVNVVPRIRSIYRWDGDTEDEDEALALIKTVPGTVADLERRIEEIHPYDVPEFLALPVSRGSEAYVRWVEAAVGSVGFGVHEKTTEE